MPPPLLPQHYAAAAGHLPTLELLLHVAPSSAAALDEGEDSPLHVAAAAGLPDAVRLLMAAAPDAVTSPGRTGLTPIELALGSNTLQHTTGAQRQAAARLLLAAAPAGDLLPALQRAGRERGWPLIPDAVALHLPLSEDDWDLVRCWLLVLGSWGGWCVLAMAAHVGTLRLALGLASRACTSPNLMCGPCPSATCRSRSTCLGWGVPCPLRWRTPVTRRGS